MLCHFTGAIMLSDVILSVMAPSQQVSYQTFLTIFLRNSIF
jgi:hypothetical protein